MFFFFNVPAPTEIYTLSLHDALPIYLLKQACEEFETTVVVATHNPQAARYGNRHFEIRDGTLATLK